MFSNFVDLNNIPMKKFLVRPGFEAMFYTGLLLLIVLPAMVFAQSTNRSVNINVINNDTLINGKKISELKPAEKKEAKEALATLGAERMSRTDYVFNLRGALSKDTSLTKSPSVRYSVRNGRLTTPGLKIDSNHRVSYFYRDSANKAFSIYSSDHMPTVHPDMSHYRMPVAGVDLRAYRMPIAHPGERGVITLDYNSTDKNGIPTRSNFRVSGALPEMEKKLSGGNAVDLAITDIALVPELSTGKTFMVFTLLNATAADVSFTDTDGKVLWNEKSTGGKFFKSFLLPMNGIYYLVVKQGGKAAVRKVVKE